MPTATAKQLTTRTARRAIPRGKATWWLAFSQGRALGYRRGERGGVWVARYCVDGFRREEKLGVADDSAEADKVQVLDFAQAQEKAAKWFLMAVREATGETPATRRHGYTVGMAVEDYLVELERRGSPSVAIIRYNLKAYVTPDLGAVRVDRLTPERMSAWHAGIAARSRCMRLQEKKRSRRRR